MIPAQKLLVIGASAGGFEALRGLLRHLPNSSGLAAVVVLHLHPQSRLSPAAFLSVPGWLSSQEAQEKELVHERTLYFAPPGYHLLLERDRSFSLNVDDPVQWSRPSVDVLFESAADAYGPEAIGIILSGANQDGARGCAYLAAKGAEIYVQNPDEAEVSSMPRAALACCPRAHSLNLMDIGVAVQQIFKVREN